MLTLQLPQPQTQLSDGLVDASPAVAPHSSILAWKISWTEEPGRLQSMGLQSQTRLND